MSIYAQVAIETYKEFVKKALYNKIHHPNEHIIAHNIAKDVPGDWVAKQSAYYTEFEKLVPSEYKPSFERD